MAQGPEPRGRLDQTIDKIDRKLDFAVGNLPPGFFLGLFAFIAISIAVLWILTLAFQQPELYRYISPLILLGFLLLVRRLRRSAPKS